MADAVHRQAFAVLEAEGVLEHELAEAMAGWAGLRNVLAHLYLDVDQGRLHEIMVAELDVLATYAAAVARAATGP